MHPPAVTPSDRPPLEQSLAVGLRWLVVLVPASVVLLLVPVRDLLVVTIVQLSALVVLGLALAAAVSRFLERRWYVSGGRLGERIAAGASVVVLVTGVIALLTLASSAALRLAPSLQFLQLISALDIAWVTTAVMVGVGWLAGRRAGLIAAWMVGVVCVWSLWRYFDTVGFAPDGGWLVDMDALMRLVLPLDMVAAVIGIGGLILGARRAAQPTVQRSPQS